MDVCRQVGGMPLFQLMGGILIVGMLGSGLTGALGAARLLFGMGRDNVLPTKIFGHVKTETNTPTYNILIIGVLAYGGAVGLGYLGNAFQHAGELLNFGAFLAFMGVNLATFWQFNVRQRSGGRWRIPVDVVLPLVGFIFCGLIWWNLNIVAKIAGSIWLAIGVGYILVEAESRLQQATIQDHAARLATLQRSLRPDEMVLEYVLDEPSSFCFHVTRTTAAVTVVPAGRKRIEDLVERYLAEIRSSETGAETGANL
jgi:amino acid transporter